ncbi:MAG: two-component response regulator MprA [Actinomycetota bacterium]|jgi:two-component system response regulator MprA
MDKEVIQACPNKGLLADTVNDVKSAANAEFLVVVAEDDPSVRTAVERVLDLEGYQVQTANDGNSALELIVSSKPHAVVMDVMMPFIDGLTVTRELRQRGNRTPVLLLTARHEVGDRVAGLDAGADDYLVKPFAVDELLARVRALLRRYESPTSAAVMSISDLTMDVNKREVKRGGKVLDLTKTEFDLLHILLEQKDIVLSREYLYEHIWGFSFETNSKSLDVYIGYLRRKLDDSGDEKLLHTIRGVGYVMRQT